MSLLRRIGRPIPPIDLMVLQDADKLQEWWQNLVNTNGRFAAYGLFLVLPSDEDVITYLRTRGSELNQISGERCLIMAMTDLTSSTDAGEFKDSEWAESIDDYVRKGYSLRANKLFGLDFTDFPCLTLFRDIDAQDFIVIRMKDLSLEEITNLMRKVFSVIDQGEDPLQAVAEYQKKEKLKKAGHMVISEILSLADSTFATVIQSLIQASVSPS